MSCCCKLKTLYGEKGSKTFDKDLISFEKEVRDAELNQTRQRVRILAFLVVLVPFLINLWVFPLYTLAIFATNWAVIA